MALSIGSTNLIDLGPLSISDYPFTLTGWFRVPASSSLLTLVRFRNTTTSSYHGLNFEGHNANYVSAMSKVTTASAARSTIPMTSGQWHHVTGVFESSTLRRVYLDGGNQGQAYHEKLFDGMDDHSLGNLASSTAIEAAEVAVLNIALGFDEIQMLASGISPMAVLDLQDVLCFHDCLRRVNRPGLGPLATSAGSASITTHPRVFNAHGSRSAVQPCRFAGPYALEQEACHTDCSIQAQVFLSGIEANSGEAAAA